MPVERTIMPVKQRKVANMFSVSFTHLNGRGLDTLSQGPIINCAGFAWQVLDDHNAVGHMRAGSHVELCEVVVLAKVPFA